MAQYPRAARFKKSFNNPLQKSNPQIPFLNQESPMALIAYARTSTSDQSTDLQTDALNAAGCIKVFTDQISGGTTQRPGLDEALAYIRPGDTLVVWKLDRLGRSLIHVIETINTLAERGVGFRSLTEQIDTTSNSGKLILHILAALSEFERGIIRERVNAGLDAARRRGRVGGRPKAIDRSKSEAIAAMKKQKIPPAEICSNLKISRATLYRHEAAKR
jgi:DNA invertase Pin-like site-specific DNA recombinase